jgi:hypothetical protein
LDISFQNPAIERASDPKMSFQEGFCAEKLMVYESFSFGPVFERESEP